MKRRRILKANCPFLILGNRVSWGYFIETHLKAGMLILLGYIYFLINVHLAIYLGGWE